MLRYAMSLPVTTTITGFADMDTLKQNLEVAQNFTPLSESEMQAFRDRARPHAADGRYEP
jgi:predicted aldo/keto reductase-like oxidoreductase